MNITKKRLNKIKKTKNQSKRVIHKYNKKNKKNNTIKNKRKAYNLKNKSFKLLKKRKRKYKGGDPDTEESVDKLQLWTPLDDIQEDEVEENEEAVDKLQLWTPLDDIQEEEDEVEENEEEVKEEEENEEEIEEENEEEVKEEEENEEEVKEEEEKKEELKEEEEVKEKGAKNKTDNKKKKSSFFSRSSKNKPIKLKEYDETKHEKLMEVLKASGKFNNLIEAIKGKISNKKSEAKEDEFYFQIHNQLMNTKLFENFVNEFEEKDDFDEEKGIEHIAIKFTESKDDNIKKIIQLIKGEEEGGDEGEQEEGGDDGEGEEEGEDSGQVGGGKKLLKWINDLKKDLKDAELGAHLKEVVRLPKKELFLTLNFVEDTKENNENKNKPSQDILTTSRSIATTTENVLDQLTLELGDHILEANKIKDGDKGQKPDTEGDETKDQ